MRGKVARRRGGAATVGEPAVREQHLVRVRVRVRVRVGVRVRVRVRVNPNPNPNQIVEEAEDAVGRLVDRGDDGAAWKVVGARVRARVRARGGARVRVRGGVRLRVRGAVGSRAVRPARERDLSMAITSCAILASRPEVGSSTRSTAGSASSSIPIDTRFRCPPLSPRECTEPILVCASSGPSDSWASTAATRALQAARRRLSCAAKWSASAAVSPASSTSSCGIVRISPRDRP